MPQCHNATAESRNGKNEDERSAAQRSAAQRSDQQRNPISLYIKQVGCISLVFLFSCF